MKTTITLRAACGLSMALVLSVVAGCAAKPPRQPDQICDIFRQHPAWHRVLKEVRRVWGLHPSIVLAFIHQESSFVADARPPETAVSEEHEASGAWGYGQALQGTWEEYREQRPNLDAHRENFADAADFIGWYNDRSQVELGLKPNDARNLYLAFHEGRGGYERGSYKAEDKMWLQQVANKVSIRAGMYRKQYRSCPFRSDRNRHVKPGR